MFPGDGGLWNRHLSQEWLRRWVHWYVPLLLSPRHGYPATQTIREYTEWKLRERESLYGEFPTVPDFGGGAAGGHLFS